MSLELGSWHLAETVAVAIETLGILVISVGGLVAVLTIARLKSADSSANAYQAFRRQMARWLLLGLELLIAADVITTVTLDLDLASVAALGLLVLIRTFLAWAIVMVDEGRWPWQRSRDLTPTQES